MKTRVEYEDCTLIRVLAENPEFCRGCCFDPMSGGTQGECLEFRSLISEDGSLSISATCREDVWKRIPKPENKQRRKGCLQPEN